MKTSSSYTTIAYLFMAPALILMGIFTFWPVGFNTYLAFHDYALVDGTATWNNFAHFKYIAGEELFHSAIKNSLLFLLVVPVIQLAALVVAKLVNSKLPGMTFFRASYYIPVITAVSIAAVVWSNVYKYDGMLNMILSWVGQALHLLKAGEMVEIQWIGDPHIAIFSVMGFVFWKGIGYYMVLYLAGLQAIPAEVEEAAVLDGANAWQRFWKITVPMVKPTILLCTLLSTIAAIKAFQEVVVLTRGQSDTYTALFYVYAQAFQNYNFGRAAAAGLVITFFCMILAIIQFRFFGEKK
ncbi:Lactose transport system permease protein LacF [Andreprevotia sp. IGB-42]|uniref:carbohydrate ABC transporter permease n=1 Tax=Andreprevotia sp. IGB-42 TaxID=2497473 RepID=UPI00157F09D7|nr:sugar ABC transporter permease [Andreprevotia sp. IGB-42]KAF0813125.1 Lactose transport system permease protein LacF [Andreprevotia sp. IGB-42]